MKEKDNAKSRNRATNKAVRNKVRKHRKVVGTRARVNAARKQHNTTQVTALGLFVALLKERGFVRHEQLRRTYYKVLDNGDTQLVLLDYIKDNAALLLCGSAENDGPDVQHVLYYHEQPLAQVTIKWLAGLERKKADDAERQRVRSKIKKWEKEAPRTAPSAWKTDLALVHELGKLKE